MYKKSIDSLKGEFKHISKKDNETGIISGLLTKRLKKNRIKLKQLYKKFNNNNNKCSKCSFYIKSGGSNNSSENFSTFDNMSGGSAKNIYIENKDLCYVGSRIKLKNPHIVSIAGKKVEYNYKPVIRRCNKHDNKIKHIN
jgi:hypothetical protein